MATCCCCFGRSTSKRSSSWHADADYISSTTITKPGDHAYPMRCLLLYTNDMEAAYAEIDSKGGRVTHKLSNFVLVASLPETFNASSLKNSSTKSPSKRSMDNISALMARAWLSIKLKAQDTIERPIPLVKRGSIALTVLVVSGERSDLQFSDIEIEQIQSNILEGTQSLIASQPSAKLSFTLHYDSITVSPAEKVPDTAITRWPGGVVFNGKLYCFHQGRGGNLKTLMYNVFDGSKWEGDKVVPNVTMSEGPSAVVFKDKLYCFHQGHETREEVWYNVFNGSSWEGDKQVPNTRITAGPSVVVYGDKLYCVHQGWTGHDYELWYNVFDGSTWAGDVLVQGTFITASPSAVVFKGLIYCFYQGAEDDKNTLLMNVFDPAMGLWSGHSKVPFISCMSNGPSAVVFDDKIYLLHESLNDSGTLWFSSTSDGIVWKGSTPVADVRITDGPAAVVFEDGLYCVYQGAGDSVGQLWYRTFASGGLEWENVWVDPALQQLGYGSAYDGYKELAEDARTTYKTNYGYVACITKYPLLYNAYADGTRLCIQYPSDNIGTTFAQIFDSNGIYKEILDTGTEPRYTFAQSSALASQTAMSLYATRFVFHQGFSKGNQLWFSFFDRRSARWAEMQGPKTSTTYTGISALFYNSKLYVSYSADSGGSLFYNVLEGSSWDKEQVVPATSSSGTPSIVIFNDKLHYFHQGGDSNGELRYNVFDIESNTWEGDVLVPDTPIASGPSAVVYKNKLYCFYRAQLSNSPNGALRYNVFDGNAWGGDTLVFNTFVTGDPSAVLYNDKIYCLHQGGLNHGQLWWNVFDGTDWDGDKRVILEDLNVSDGPSALVSDGKIYCFFRARGYPANREIWYNVFDGSDWAGQLILTTGSGTSTQPGVVSIDSSSVSWDVCPA